MRRGRLGEPLLAGAAALVVGWSVLVACSGISTGSAGPVAGCFPGASPFTCNVVQVNVTADGPYTVTLNNETHPGSTSGTFEVYNVALGASDITGTTSANSLTIALASVTTTPNGGVQRGGLTVSAGPGATAAACSVTFTIPSGGLKPQSFQARYTLYSGPDRC